MGEFIYGHFDDLVGDRAPTICSVPPLEEPRLFVPGSKTVIIQKLFNVTRGYIEPPTNFGGRELAASDVPSEGSNRNS